ncbi:aminotransferase class V-fold PLP-dependent enzyme [Streptomyces sp. NPDC058469]|uniref:aminotransferase class V-fold PLP-dependent enzyme n=1 Tax=Streptomyces sp. NPDC058469 TaxID=3346514 RepID=UPI00365BE291
MLGTVLPVRAMADAAHAHGAVVLVDGAQAVPHLRVDVGELGADFYVLSGHKLFGPTGIGVLYGRSELLEEMPPWQGGGSMITSVSFEHTQYAPPPQKFEAGTGHIAGAIGLGAAVDYLESIGLDAAHAHETALVAYARRRLTDDVPGLRLLGPPNGVGVTTFTVDGADPAQIARTLDAAGIAVRAGHHCAQPVLRRYGLTAAVRPLLRLLQHPRRSRPARTGVEPWPGRPSDGSQTHPGRPTTKSPQAGARLLMTMPELVPELGPVRRAGAALGAEGLGKDEVLTGSRTQRAAVRREFSACPWSASTWSVASDRRAPARPYRRTSGLRPRLTALLDSHGPLCSPLDTWHEALPLPLPSPGDLLTVPNVGAYGLTAALLGFLSHQPAAEICVEGDTVVSATRLQLQRNALTPRTRSL